jgi:predicted alpha/beta hydrolase family esterase
MLVAESLGCAVVVIVNVVANKQVDRILFIFLGFKKLVLPGIIVRGIS